ncbi:MAG: NAD(P)-dependent glycerol-3-phosphate dehydrogenase [Candidatus Omnitrophica bacterium]|nr:NAD(P)-dependent glycerol-3-phosphate dehydrogenase [Candidatus Omnitrophota bacterium]MDD5310927.1 NAD(P)-dependent glycerol-3-phosphate dehydrogenase [Candidatus Omnitrophota bacterium]MDD5545799.1 NAD(P)-dependent glycerol-3-phosphate dehydrogenase [Candidatus Omnitrophota bacterium]
MNTKKITLIGDGGWGTTLAMMLNARGNKVALWGAFPDYIETMKSARENVKFLPGIKIPDPILLTSDLAGAVRDADILVLAVPSQHVREVANRMKGINLNGKLIVSVSKGIENHSMMRMSQVVRDVLGKVRIGALSGPTISYEVARGLPTTVVAASEDEKTAQEIQDLFMTETFRVYTNTDIIGVELGGSIKNVIAIAAGISDGMGFGVNTKSGMLVRGIVEIARLGTAMGAKQETFYGISGLGDLVTTCVSTHGRNRWFGEEIGKGNKPEQVLKSTEMVVEGVGTAESCHELQKKYSIEMPIAEEIYAIIYDGKDPKAAVRDLMTRKKKSESNN